MNNELYTWYFNLFCRDLISEYRNTVNFFSEYSDFAAIEKTFGGAFGREKREEFIQAKKDYIAIKDSPLYNALREQTSEEKKK